MSVLFWLFFFFITLIFYLLRLKASFIPKQNRGLVWDNGAPLCVCRNFLINQNVRLIFLYVDIT